MTDKTLTGSVAKPGITGGAPFAASPFGASARTRSLTKAKSCQADAHEWVRALHLSGAGYYAKHPIVDNVVDQKLGAVMTRTCVAVLGFGEAGTAISADLVAAGAVVRGYDPVAQVTPGVVDCAAEAEAVLGADVVLSLNSADD